MRIGSVYLEKEEKSQLELAKERKIQRELARKEPSHLDPVPDELYSPSETDIEEAAGHDIRKLWHPLSKYTPAQKILAVTTYLYCGNFKKCERITGIPEFNIRGWRKNACWWAETEEKCRAIIDDEIEAGYRNILQVGVVSLLDKINDGEDVVVATRKRVQAVIDPKTGEQAYHFDSSGKKVYEVEEIVEKDWDKKPILSKDLNRIVGTMQEKILLLQNRPTSISQTQSSGADQALAKIGEKLGELGKKTTDLKVVSSQDGKGNEK